MPNKRIVKFSTRKHKHPSSAIGNQQVIAIILLFGLLPISGCGKVVLQSTQGESTIKAVNKHNEDIARKSVLSIEVDGNQLKNERNEVVRLRGVGIMGMEYAAVSGFSPSNPYPTIVESTWAALKKWHINTLRIPLNEISYLGLKCVSPFSGPAFNKMGEIRNSDPGNNYKTKLKEVVDRATAENLYVILDLHSTAPNDSANAVGNTTTQCAYEQNPLPDADHSIEFWRDLATAYKTYPNVMFEIFNNPYIDNWPYFAGNSLDAWKALRDGIKVNSYLPLWPTSKKHLWQSAGTQQLVDTIRETGATNILLQGGISRSANLEHWLSYRAKDSLNQSVAVWHAFPPSNAKWEDKCYSYPGPWCDERAYEYAREVLDAGYPVVVTEFGEKNRPGMTTAPFVSALLPRLDAMGISYVGWTFITTDMLTDYELVKDNLGTPTDGYGEYVKAHYICVALGIMPCASRDDHLTTTSALSFEESSDVVARGWTPLATPF